MMIQNLSQFLLGALAMASFICSLFFLRFHRDTKDRLFLFFSISFLLEGVNRTLLAVQSANWTEGDPWLYLIRLFAYLTILVGIVSKNLEAKS